MRTEQEIRESYADLLRENPHLAADVEQMVADEVEQERVLVAAGDPPPCPEWCEHRDDGHGEGNLSVSAEGGFVALAHKRSVGDGVSLFQMDTYGAVPFRSPVVIHADVDSWRDFYADEARALARHLLDAARRLDEINGAAR